MIGARKQRSGLLILAWSAWLWLGTAGCLVIPPDLIQGGGGGGGGGFTSDNDRISTAVEMNPVNKDLYHFDTLRNDTDPSRALGLPGNGSIFNAINLPDSQAGYRHHYGVAADAPDKDDWGVLALINKLEAVAAAWRDPTRPCIVPKDNPNPPELFQVGDLSKGVASTRSFGGFWSDHPLSHQNGLDVDLRFIRTDHKNEPLDLSGPEAIFYDRGATTDLMWCFLDQPSVTLLVVDTVLAKVDFFGDTRIQHKTDHQDHFHIRINDPDGTTN